MACLESMYIYIYIYVFICTYLYLSVHERVEMACLECKVCCCRVCCSVYVAACGVRCAMAHVSESRHTCQWVMAPVSGSLQIFQCLECPVSKAPLNHDTLIAGAFHPQVGLLVSRSRGDKKRRSKRQQHTIHLWRA